jgi:LPS sulfotransferase NodH
MIPMFRMVSKNQRMTGIVENKSPAPTSVSDVTIERKRRPVFVMGCHRSGTNLLYDTLLSAGGFAVYRGFLPLYEVLIPRFGSPENAINRAKIVETWMQSKSFVRAGVEAATLSSKLLADCQTGGDFIRIVMEQISQNQSAQRWAVYEPDNVLHVARIKKDLPDALFVHILRDGRDIALSLMKMEGFRPFPWSGARGLHETALYWQWMVQKGRHYGRQIPHDYIEIHYEELVTEPRNVLARLGEFLDHDLDYDRIQNTRLGRLLESNSSFFGDEKETKNPVNRWKEKLSEEQVKELEAIIGTALREFGYPLTGNTEQTAAGFRLKCLSAVYPSFLSIKHWLKLNTPMSRFTDISSVAPQDSAAKHID